MSKKLLVILCVVVLSIIVTAIILGGILIKQNKPIGIKVASISHKSIYYIGEQLDISNLSIVLLSEKRQLRYLSGEEYIVEGFDSSKVGNVTLTVRYGEFTTQYTVVIRELPAEKPSYLSLEMYFMPTKTVYNIGEKLSVDGGFLKINYSDGTYDIVELLPLMTYGFSSEEVGKVTVYVSYLGMETSFQVTVV